MGCGDKNKPAVYLARVNDSYLTEDEFIALYDSTAKTPAETSELYQQWVRTEILYQKAIKEGITSDIKYTYLLNRAKKEIAGALLLQKLADDSKFACSEEELKNTYAQDKWQFVAGDKGYLYNYASFSNENAADKFYKLILAGSWNSAYSAIKADSGQTVLLNLYKNGYQLESGLLYRLLSSLSPGETTPPVNTGPGKYMLVGLIQQVPADSVPPLSVLKPVLEKRVIARKKADYIEKYLKDIYSESTIDILNPDF